MSMHPAVAVALRALRRNTLQTALTILGMTIGVAAVLTMIALGTGAETAIEDQVRAAGMNLIVVTAGNYKPKADDDFGGTAVEPSARREEQQERRTENDRFFPPRSIRKTTRWKSTIIRPRGSASATAKPVSDPRRRSAPPTPTRFASCAASSTWPKASTRTFT